MFSEQVISVGFELAVTETAITQIKHFTAIVHGSCDGCKTVGNAGTAGRTELRPATATELVENPEGSDFYAVRDATDAFAISNGSCDDARNESTMSVLVQRKRVQRIPIVTPDVVDQVVLLIIDSIVERRSAFAGLGVDRTSQVGVQQGHTRINHGNQQSGLRLVDEIGGRPSDVDTSRTGLPVYQLSRVVKRPLIRILRVSGLRLSNEVWFSIEDDGFTCDFFGECNRRTFGFIEGINMDAEQLDLLRQGHALTRLKFRDCNIVRSRTILHEQHPGSVFPRERHRAKNEQEGDGLEEIFHRKSPRILTRKHEGSLSSCQKTVKRPRKPGPSCTTGGRLSRRASSSGRCPSRTSPRPR